MNPPFYSWVGSQPTTQSGQQVPQVQLTEQQRIIVNHKQGPALVFAVAGAGKTTAMAHRIQRLVQDRIFPPQQILATTFNRSAADELRARVGVWPACDPVDIRTLHSLGGAVVMRAYQRGYLPYLKAQAFERIEGATEIILNKTLTVARSRKVAYAEELNHFDRQRFLTTLGIWKGQLAYANLTQTALPVAAHSIARQAEAPKTSPWYLDLYRLYEEVRLSEGLLTFDDQLMTGWELLLRYPVLLREIQQRYQCVLVDEFQDINLVQSELLDLITAPHRNYMAIGDDDQTIYEWRGADANFILNFETRYRAPVYFMTENFRCTAGQVVLANGVIRHNQQRRAKQLQLTRGFGGVTQFQQHANAERMGRVIAEQIKTAQAQGQRLEQIVVLVRVYAQTPPVEQALMAANLPYVIEGEAPFYQRSEVQTLIDYCRLAFTEQRLLAGEPLTPEQLRQFETSWRQVYWQPKRYISRELSQKIVEYVATTGTPLTATLRLFASEAKPTVAEKMTALAETLLWLIAALPGGVRATWSAAQVLTGLEQRIHYRHFLAEESGFAESGIAKADTVSAFLEYAQEKGTLLPFLQTVRQLILRGAQIVQTDRANKVTITTIFRAKGREWPLVIVPHCNEGFFPYKAADNREEERRLLYVAITRARQELHLHALQEAELSSFLVDAQYKQLLVAVRQITEALLKAPATWSTQDFLAMAIHVRQLHLQSYFQHWSDWSTDQQQAVASQMLRFFHTVAERQLFAKLNLAPDFADMWRAMLTSKAAPSTLELPELAQMAPKQEPSFLQRQLSKIFTPRPPTGANTPIPPLLPPSIVQWEVGMRVVHPTLGPGRVIKVLRTLTPPILWVRFDEAGTPQRFPLDTDQLQRP